MQILHYYCRKQHKNIENPQIIEQNFVISLSGLLSAYCDLRLLPSLSFSVLGHSTPRISNVTRSFAPYMVSFRGLKMAFSKLSLAKYHCLHKKNHVYSNCHLLYFMVRKNDIEMY